MILSKSCFYSVLQSTKIVWVIQTKFGFLASEWCDIANFACGCFFVCFFFSPLAWCGLVVFQFSVFSFLFGFSVLLLLPFHLRAVWHWSFALLQTLGKFCLRWIRNRCRHFLAHKVMWQIFHKYIWPAGERVQ